MDNIGNFIFPLFLSKKILTLERDLKRFYAYGSPNFPI